MAQAILRRAANVKAPKATGFKNLEGKGAQVEIDGKTALLGNKLIQAVRRGHQVLDSIHYDIDPGSYLPKVMTMTDFNLWTWNSRVFPGIDPLVVRRGDRVRVRIGNLTMTNHPIHMHGPHFEVTCTDGGWVRESARWPEVTTDVPVGAMRAVEFVADEPGDWAIHCHKAHHAFDPRPHAPDWPAPPQSDHSPRTDSPRPCEQSIPQLLC